MVMYIKLNGGPGTGKTYEIVEYIKALQATTELKNIIAGTFRRTASEDFINKLDIDDKEDRRYMGTIHSICFRLLGYPDMITNTELQIFCKQVGLAPPLNHPFNWQDTDNEPIGKQSAFLNLYGWTKNTLTPLDKIAMYPQIRELKLPMAHIKTLIEKYEDYKKEIGKIDFTDQISEVITHRLTPDSAQVLLVDEFQDLTPAQFEVFKIWAAAVDIVIIAGDPNQTVYPFWGATSKFFTDYEAEERILSTTHRVPVPVWNTARKLLEVNGVGVPDVTSDKAGTLNRITYKQAEQVIGDYDKDTLHLIRSNYQGVAISYQLAEAGIIYTGLNSWTDHEINLLNGIIQLRKQQTTEKDIHLYKKELVEIIDKFPDRYFKINTTKNELIKTVGDLKKPQYSLSKINSILETQQTLHGPDTLYDVIKSNDPTSHMKAGKLLKLKISRALKRYDQRVKVDAHTVRISTIHGAKGGEADTVFLHTAITPKIKKAMRTKEGRQDEARVFFVGLTRTAQTCYMVKDKGPNNYNVPVVS